MNRLVYQLLRAFFPRRCIYCNDVTMPDDMACRRCRQHLPRIVGPFCHRCGRSSATCTCKKRRRHFDRCVAVMEYRDGVDHAVWRLKKTEDDDIVDTMSAEMVAALRSRADAASLDVVTFVPMRKKELRKRGYNQSQRLAEAVAKQLDIPCRPLLIKLYDTKSQKDLKHHARQGNLLGVFDVTEPVQDKHVLVVDDVITTGATLHECAKMLKLRGAAAVTVLTFAATVKNQKPEDDDDLV